jgi:hypothetical protein
MFVRSALLVLSVFMTVLAGLCASADAQVIITAKDVRTQLAVGNTITNNTDTLATTVNIGSPGATSWDFSGLLSHEARAATSLQMPTAFDTAFPNANHVLKTTLSGVVNVPFSGSTIPATVTGDLYLYFAVGAGFLNPGTFGSGTAKANIGGFPITTDGTLKISNSPAEVTYPLPLNLGASWKSVFATTQTIVLSLGIPVAPTVTNHDISDTVDAFGKMKMPDGLQYDALRIRREERVGGNTMSYIFVAKNGATVQFTAADAAQPSSGTIQVSRKSISWSPPFTSILPLALTPLDSATGVPFPVLFQWSPCTGALSYGLQISTDNFSAVVFDDPTLTGTSKEIALSPGTRYHWRMRVNTAGGTSPWGQVWTFVTVAAPEVPLALAPADSATDLPQPVIFRWLPSTGAVGYRLQVSSDHFTTSVFDDSTITGTSKEVTLAPGTKYSWRLNARNQFATSSWGPAGIFTTGNVPGPVALAFPGQGDIVQADSLRLRWLRGDAQTGRFWFEMSSDSAFSSKRLDSSLSDTSYLVQDLMKGATYWWRVRTNNTWGWGSFSEVRTFSTRVDLPGVVLLSYPPNGVTLSGDSIRAGWHRSAPATTRYWFEISPDSTFTHSLLDSTVVDSIFLARGLQKGSTYWWRVKACNAAGWGSFSDVWRFSISVTGIAIQNLVPASYQLDQNYPNPFNPSTTIRYGLPHESQVTLMVYNTLGQVVSQIVSGEREAGYHEVRFDATGLSSGVYFYRLTAGDFVRTRKLLLAR